MKTTTLYRWFGAAIWLCAASASAQVDPEAGDAPPATSDPAEAQETEPGTETAPEAEPETETAPEAEPETETAPEAEPETETATEAPAETATEAEAPAEAATEAPAETATEAEAEAPAEAETEADIATAPSSDITVAPDTATEAASGSAAEKAEPESPADSLPAADKRAINSGVRGRITEVDTGGPLARVLVSVYEGGQGATFTDDDGKFTLPLAAGNYIIRIVSDIHRPKRASVKVFRGRFTPLDTALKFIESAVEVVMVEARMESGNEATQLEVRRRATTLSDSMSAQEISRGADSSAAGALKRVVSATVVDGKYVMVRGLGGRYMSTLLNGVPLPSSEPDRQAVPLDLFPTSLLANLNIAKSYSAAAPGTFAGGTVMIETNAYPTEFTLTTKIKTNGTSNTTGETLLTNSGGSGDFFGFGSSSRALPDEVPRSHPLRVGEAGMNTAEVADAARSFDNRWSPGERTSYPDLSLGLSVGDTIRAGGSKLGYLATATFSHAFDAAQIRSGKVRNGSESLEYRQRTNTVIGTETATIGALGNVGYELSDGHDIGVFGLFSHTGQASATVGTGLNEADGEEFRSSRLKFVERSLGFTQLAGRHRLGRSGGFLLKWQANASVTERHEPDTRDITYNLLADGRERFKSEPGSGERFFSGLSEMSGGGGVHGETNIGPVLARMGAVGQSSGRDFAARRFRMEFVGSDPSALFQGPDRIFSDEMIGTAFRLNERTLATDAYEASLLLGAVYAEGEIAPHEKLRLIGGLRFESAQQKMTPGSLFGLGEITESDIVSRRDDNFLPAAAAVFALNDKMNLRGAYSYTLARPHYRELAPFLYFDYARRRSVSGNPNLTQTRIHNADLRWEWFASTSEVLATSVFYKRFADPIEQVIVSASGGDVSYDNAVSATSVGAELEARVGLRHLSKALTGFRAQSNVSLIRSRVELSPDQLMSQTSRRRPLQGQSPYVLNVGLGYGNEDIGLDTNIFYNVFGRRIAEVGFDSLPDVYEQPQHRLDITAAKDLGRGFRLKLAGRNLLNQNRVLDQGGLPVFVDQPGVQASASLEWAQ